MLQYTQCQNCLTQSTNEKPTLSGQNLHLFLSHVAATPEQVTTTAAKLVQHKPVHCLITLQTELFSIPDQIIAAAVYRLAPHVFCRHDNQAYQTDYNQ